MASNGVEFGELKPAEVIAGSFVYFFQFEASKTNALVESSLAGNWLAFAFWLGGFILIIVQKFFLRKQKQEMDRYTYNVLQLIQSLEIILISRFDTLGFVCPFFTHMPNLCCS